MTDTVKTLGLAFDTDHRNGYSSGDVVSGHVLIEVSDLTNIKAVTLSAKGYARVYWIDGPRRETSPISHCVDERECLSISQTLLVATDSEDIQLNVGRHVIPFEFQLPQRPLVTSFTGKYGSVCYVVKGALQRPSGQELHVCREIPVISHIDINTPTLLCPISKSNEKMIGWWLFTSGPISLKIKIERQGYCNGESIPIYAEIENCSSRLIVPRAAICQTQMYVANGKTKTHQLEMAQVRGNHIPSGSADTWNGKTLKIPPVPPSILNSPILRVEYSLVVLVQIPGAKKLRVELPLVIGTIPYCGFGSRSASVSSHFSMDLSWLALALPDTPEAPPNYLDVVSEEERERRRPSRQQAEELERQLGGPAFAYIQEFRFQPPPIYSEVDPFPEVRSSTPLLSLCMTG